MSMSKNDDDGVLSSKRHNFCRSSLVNTTATLAVRKYTQKSALPNPSPPTAPKKSKQLPNTISSNSEKQRSHEQSQQRHIYYTPLWRACREDRIIFETKLAFIITYAFASAPNIQYQLQVSQFSAWNAIQRAIMLRHGMGTNERHHRRHSNAMFRDSALSDAPKSIQAYLHRCAKLKSTERMRSEVRSFVNVFSDQITNSLPNLFNAKDYEHLFIQLGGLLVYSYTNMTRLLMLHHEQKTKFLINKDNIPPYEGTMITYTDVLTEVEEAAIAASDKIKEEEEELVPFPRKASAILENVQAEKTQHKLFTQQHIRRYQGDTVVAYLHPLHKKEDGGNNVWHLTRWELQSRRSHGFVPTLPPSTDLLVFYLLHPNLFTLGMSPTTIETRTTTTPLQPYDILRAGTHLLLKRVPQHVYTQLMSQK